MPDYITTAGQITSCEVGIMKGVSMQSSIMVERYYPKVTYQYSVNGVDYENDRFYDEEIQINQIEKIEAVVAKYPVGTDVTVYFEAQNPSNAYLERLPDINFNTIKFWALGIGIIILVGIALLIFFLLQG